LETKPFAELCLSPKVLAAVEAAGYTTATPIQSAAIPLAVAGRDVLGIAQTGTGKTAAFTLPMITRLESGRARARMPRSLILEPTRELAAQVEQAFEKYGINHKLDVALLIGGVSMEDQVRKLDRGVDVLIATPGRLLDHFQRGKLMLMGVEILVVDEADRMLDMGFIPDIERICKLLPPKRQTLFFSATMPPEITRLVSQFLKDPVRVEVAKPATTAKTITQRFRFCPDGEDWAKRDELRKLIRSETIKNAIIFCNRKRDVAILLKSLLKHGFNAGALHGDMDQKSRMETLDRFRSGELTLLAASDVAARGLDIPDVSHVFNFDLPWQSDDYVHRIGRTGRAGREGSAFSLVGYDDLRVLKDIEKSSAITIEWIGEPPTEQDFADSAARKRRRGGRPGRDGDRRGGEARGRGRGGERRGGERGGGEGRRERHGEPRREQRAATAAESDAAPIIAAEAGSKVPREPRRERDRPHRREDRSREARPERRERSEQPAEARREQQPHREGREERPPRAERHARPHAEGERRGEPRGAEKPQRQEAGKPPRRGGEAAPGAGGGKGFAADNVPAFMRKPARAKAVNE
jgi:superfamily II DNA/RNA helicase